MSLTNLAQRFLPAARLWCAFGTLLLALLAETAPAMATRVDAKEKAAKKACIAGDYSKGVEILSDLYVETDDLNYLFNQGRCLEQNGRYGDAINRFYEYARKLKDAGKPSDPDVERHIADCQAMIDKNTNKERDKRGATRASPAAPPATPEQPTSSTPAHTTAAFPAPSHELGASEPVSSPPLHQQAEVAQPAPSVGSRGASLRVVGIGAAGLGLAGLTTGVILNLKANTLADDLGRSDTSYSRSEESRRATYETWSWVSYGVGAACVAGGAVLYFIGRYQGKSGELAVVPVAGPGRFGAALQGAF